MKKSEVSASKAVSSVVSSPEEQKMINEFQDVLDLLQRKGKAVSKEELSTALESLGYNPTEEEVQEMIEGAATEADTVDISYFLELMAKRMKDEDSALRLREAFGSFDKDQNGFISATELRNALRNMGEENLTDKDVDRMIRLADIDGDGQVDFEEFVNMMMSR